MTVERNVMKNSRSPYSGRSDSGPVQHLSAVLQSFKIAGTRGDTNCVSTERDFAALPRTVQMAVLLLPRGLRVPLRVSGLQTPSY